MIQRIQTAYLALGSVIVTLPLMLGNLAVESTAQNWFPWIRLGLSVVAAVLGVVAIFGYGNRKRQSTTTFYAQVAVLLLLLVVVATTILYGARPGVETWTRDVYHLSALVLPAIAYILFGLARRAIRRDAELVKSMDRLRP